MADILAALIPPGVMAGVCIAFVVWLIRSQLANKSKQEDHEQDRATDVQDDTNS